MPGEVRDHRGQDSVKRAESMKKASTQHVGKQVHSMSESKYTACWKASTQHVGKQVENKAQSIWKAR